MELVEKYRVGDKVRVRTWEDMEAEYGLCDDYIAIPFSFVPEMKKYCGKVVTIEGVYDCYTIKENDPDRTWSFNDLMFEEAKNTISCYLQRRRQCIRSDKR